MKISLSIFAALLFGGLSALAHIEPGLYLGQTADGQACEITAGTNYFVEDTPHPLNERIEMTYKGKNFTIQHPPMVDEATGTVYFNHDAFHGILATSTGGMALVIHMVHTDAYEGPASFTVMDHRWKSNTKTSVTCLNIKKQ